MVRLKDQPDTERTVGEKFQFQNGTIKRDVGDGSIIVVLEFQFQNGTIKRKRFGCKLAAEKISIPKWYD